MNNKIIKDIVVQELINNGFVNVEISARHVHLCQNDVDKLFGNGHKLTPKRDLSQPGQYLCEERVNIVGSKGEFKNVAILGPARRASQVEISATDSRILGVKPVLRESGNIADTPSITLATDKASITIEEGVIVAHSHIHVPVNIAEKLSLKDKQKVSVKLLTERPITLNDIVIRVSDNFAFHMHVDFDEANSAMVTKGTIGQIIV